MEIFAVEYTEDLEIVQRSSGAGEFIKKVEFVFKRAQRRCLSGCL